MALDPTHVGREFHKFTLNRDNETAVRTVSEISNSLANPIPIKYEPQYVDPFGRFITSQPIQIGSTDHRINKRPEYWNEVLTGSGTSTHNANTVSVDMATTTASGDKVVRQTYRSFEYTRGNSQSIFISCNLGAGAVGNRKRVGYFDAYNGAFFEISDGVFRVVRRSSTSGSPVDSSINQADFNGDKLDGYGLSGFTLDTTKQNLYWIEFSWLGTNIVRFGVVINGNKIIMHTINNANIIATPWCQTGMLPVRAEIENTATTNSANVLSFTCMAVFSNGSRDKENPVKSISTVVTPISVSGADAVLAGIRLRPGLRNVSAQAATYDITPVSGNSFLYFRAILRPTLTGGTWVDFNDIVQVLTVAPTYTEGTGHILDQGHISLSATNRNRLEVDTKSDIFLGYGIDGTPDALVLTARTTSGTGSIHFDGFFREIY